ncbi:MAG: hypothetical protein EHM61_15900 [Acidobacteria bacterium]|nr:MAG: hypothetical protein EHM61_15900 [Acidobacteriota bacterium]
MHLLGTILVACTLSSVLSAQGTGTTSPGEVPGGDASDNGVWLDVPFFPQRENGCGASSLAMVIQYWKSPPAGDPDVIFSSLYSEEQQGIPASRLTEYLEANGFHAFTFRGDLSEAKKHLLKGRPLIVSLKRSTLHYVVVVGFDEQEKVVLLNDPAVKKLSKMDEREFLKSWKPTDHWTLLAVPDGTLQ